MRRIVVHDFSGHPFQVQLSRALAARGHEVLHLHCASFTTGKGRTSRGPDDPPTFHLDSIDLGESFVRYRFRRRFAQELRYGRMAVDAIRAFGPDVLVSCNVPLIAHGLIQRWAQRDGVAFVFWHQDFYGTAMRDAAGRRLPVVGSELGRTFEFAERTMLQRSDAVVGISPDFAARYDSLGLDRERTTVIENWAPLDELPVAPRHSAWAERHDLVHTTNLVYAGTLGMKHNPGLLADLAEETLDRPEVRVVVVSEGAGADWLVTQRRERGLDNLVLLPYQAYEELPLVLGTGDVLVAILEPAASRFSVPSKVLSYHCAGRALLGALPADNLAAEVIRRNGSGRVVDVTDTGAFVSAALAMLDDGDGREAMGRAARAYAETTFDLDTITDRFIEVFARAGAPAVARDLVIDLDGGHDVIIDLDQHIGDTRA